MAAEPMQAVAEAVVRRARQQGFVVPKDIRTELRLAGLDETKWKSVLELAHDALVYRQGRYYPLTNVSSRMQEAQEHLQAIGKAIRALLRRHRAQQREQERRGQKRVDLIVPVVATFDDGREHRLVSRDISESGIRLLGAKRLLGQRVRLSLQPEPEKPALVLIVRILWTCSIGDDLFENGGTFLEVVS